MSAFRKLQKGVSKGVIQTTRFAQGAADRIKDGTIDIVKAANEGIREGLTDDKSRELKRNNSDQFHADDDDDEDPDLGMRMSLAVPNGRPKKNVHEMAGYSIRPPGNTAGVDTSDDEDMYMEPVSESQQGEMGLNDDDDDSAKATKKKKKVRKIKYKKSEDDSDGSDASAKSSKSTKSSKSSKSGKSRKKKGRAKKSDASVGSRKKKKDRDAVPTRQASNASLKSDTSGKKKKKKKPERIDSHFSDDHEDELTDALSPLPGSVKKDPVLPIRSKSPTRSPPTQKKAGVGAAPFSPDSADTPPEHPIKQELKRFSDIWKTQSEDDGGEGTPTRKRESLTVGRISAALGELNGEIKEEAQEDSDDQDLLEAKLRSTEQRLLDSERKVEDLIVAKRNVEKELKEEHLRNDELGRRLLELEDKVEELEAAKKELEDNPKVIEHEADPIEVFELQQEINGLKTDMSIKMDQYSDALHAKDERIKELEAQLEAGGAQPRESLRSSMHSTSSSGGDAKTQGLLLRSNDKIQKQEAEIRELKQKLEELGNVKIIEEKDEEIKNLGVQMFELETKMKEMEAKHQKALKEKEETIVFFQDQVVEMQKKIPKQPAYTRKPSTEGEEGTMTLGGEAAEEESGGFWGVVARASPGLLGGRQTVDRRKMREVPPSPKL